MKAKELYAAHREAILSSDPKVSLQGISNLMVDLSKDVNALRLSRKPKTNSAVLGIISEVNQKYNAVVSLFEQKDGFSPIRPDGFKLYWEKELPQLSTAFEQQVRKSKRDMRLQPIEPRRPVVSPYHTATMSTLPMRAH